MVINFCGRCGCFMEGDKCADCGYTKSEMLYEHQRDQLLLNGLGKEVEVLLRETQSLINAQKA